MLKTKQKLMATAVMLVVSMLMATTASFAWFTISTNPEISGLTTTTTVNENLEIALAGVTYDGTTYTAPTSGVAGSAGNSYTYGNLIDVAETTKSTATAYATVSGTALAPLGLGADNKGFILPTYGKDGRVNTTTSATIGSMTGGFGVVTDGATSSPVSYAYYIDFVVKSNMTGDLLLVAAIDRGTGEESGLGSYVTFSSANTALADAFTLGFASVALSASEDIASATITPLDYTSTGTSTTGVAYDSINAKITYTNVDTGVDITTANTDYLVRVYVYLDGASLTNEFAASAITGALNLQFGMTDLDTAMSVTASDYGRTTPSTSSTFGS